jgi:hypothetical protein
MPEFISWALGPRATRTYIAVVTALLALGLRAPLCYFVIVFFDRSWGLNPRQVAGKEMGKAC